MNTILISLLTALWIACGVIAARGLVGYSQREFPTVMDNVVAWQWMGFAYFTLGPLGALIVYFFTGGYKHGFRWREITLDERIALICRAHGEDMVDYLRRQGRLPQ